MTNARTIDSPIVRIGRAWRYAWNRYWFPRTTAVRLAMMRIIVVGLQLMWFFPPLAYQQRLVRGNDGFHQPELVVRLMTSVVGENLFRTEWFITTLWYSTWVVGVLALIGLFSRTALFLFASGTWLLVTHEYSYGEKHHPEAIYCMFLLMLAFAPAGRCLSLDSLIARRRSRLCKADLQSQLLNEGWGPQAIFTTAQWPLTATVWLLAMAYLCAGLAKLAVGGLEWFNGTTLQWYLLQDAIRWGRPLGRWLATQKELCIALSIGAVAFEVCFPLVLRYRKLIPLFAAAGVAMHVGIYIVQAAPFFQFLVLYLVWVPWERLPVWRARSQPRPEAPALSSAEELVPAAGDFAPRV